MLINCTGFLYYLFRESPSITLLILYIFKKERETAFFQVNKNNKKVILFRETSSSERYYWHTQLQLQQSRIIVTLEYTQVYISRNSIIDRNTLKPVCKGNPIQHRITMAIVLRNQTKSHNNRRESDTRYNHYNE